MLIVSEEAAHWGRLFLRTNFYGPSGKGSLNLFAFIVLQFYSVGEK